MHRKITRLGAAAMMMLVMLALLAACSNTAANDTAEAAEPTAAAAVSPTMPPDQAPPAEGEGSAEENTTEESNTEESTVEESAAEESSDEAAEPPTASSTEGEAGADILPTITPTPEAAAGSTESGAEPAAPSAPIFDPAQHSISLRSVYEGFAQPLFITHAGDGSNRLFVLEKAGRIQVIQPDAGASLFLDLADRVGSSASEQGLLGLAFPPNFGETGYFFVNYTDTAGDTVISRFQVSPDNPNQADPASEFVILQLDQPAANHNGGMLVFGPDGYLWIGTGDGGAANNRFGTAMNPQSLLGKMLRIDVTSNPDEPYTIPPDNPWVEADLNGEDVLDEIWAIGLRNPWRYSFDRATGDLWMADVGQNQYEEINWTPAGSPGGLNYGWSIMEGAHCFEEPNCDTSGLVLPVIEYSHGPHCSVTGGYVYRGDEFPALQGVYVYGDYCSGMIWAAVPNADGTVTVYDALQSNLMLSSFGESESGELYATDLSGGAIYQVVIE